MELDNLAKVANEQTNNVHDQKPFSLAIRTIIDWIKILDLFFPQILFWFFVSII